MVEAHIINAIEQFSSEIHDRINNFKICMGKKLYEAQVPDLSYLTEELVILRFEVRALAENHTSIIP